MKAIIVVGLAILSLLLVIVLRNNGLGPHPGSEGMPAFGEPPPVSMAALARRSVYLALRQTRPARPAYGALLEAIEAESDPGRKDRKDGALARAVEWVSDDALPVMLESLVRDLSPGAVEFC